MLERFIISKLCQFGGFSSRIFVKWKLYHLESFVNSNLGQLEPLLIRTYVNSILC